MNPPVETKGVPDPERPARLHGSREHPDEGLPRANPPDALREREYTAGALHGRHAGDHPLNAGDHVGKRGGESVPGGTTVTRYNR